MKDNTNFEKLWDYNTGPVSAAAAVNFCLKSLKADNLQEQSGRDVKKASERRNKRYRYKGVLDLCQK